MFFCCSILGISPLEMLAVSAEIARLKQTLQEKEDAIKKLNNQSSNKNDNKLEKHATSNDSKFGVSVILKSQKKLMGLFK